VPNYRRAKFAGGYYFFTVVTHQRRKLFLNPQARRFLHIAIRTTQEKRPFEIIAFCLLPEHLHCVWKLPQGEADFSTRWAAIKANFSKAYLPQLGSHCIQRRPNRGEVAVWQKRFWEHQIRDADDLQRHLHYIHYNPVKHGLVAHVREWPWSTYHKYVKQGMYTGFDPSTERILQMDAEEFGE